MPVGRGRTRWRSFVVATLLFGIYTSLIMTLTPPTPDASGQDGDLLGTAVAEERAVQMPPSVQDFQDLQELTAEAQMLVESAEADRFPTAVSRDLEAALISARELQMAPFPKRGEVLATARDLAAIIKQEHDNEFRRRELGEKIEKLAESASIAVVAYDVSGEKVLVELNEDQQFASASTYKLFVAYSMFEAVNGGEWDWEDRLLGSRTLGQCFDAMIIESDNECSERWLELVGPATVQKQMTQLGLTDTNVEWSAMRTTASDLAHFLSEVVVGDALNGNDLARLGDAMEQQEFREGIPAGVGSAVVWDKVGFLDQYLHDAAVVKSDKGEMILVILTAGGSWETIAEAAYAVYDSY